jgi:hypothetical protein
MDSVVACDVFHLDPNPMTTSRVLAHSDDLTFIDNSIIVTQEICMMNL